MLSDDDFRLIELLSSHLCHDLISPVSAVNNGLELVGEGEPDPELLSDAIGLMRDSGLQASNRLQFFRLAYGQAGGLDAASATQLARKLADGYLAGSKIRLDWPEPGPDAPSLSRDGAKLLLNMVALGAEALPRGGTLAVRLDAAGDGIYSEIAASGQGAALKDDLMAALAADAQVADLTPRTVQSFFTARLADRLEAGLTVDSDEADKVVLAARIRPTV